LCGECVEVCVGLAKRLVDALELGMEVHDVLHAFGNQVAHGLAGLEVRLLRQIADFVPRRTGHLPRELRIEPGHDPQKRRFPRAIEADDPYLRAIEIRKADIFKHLLRAVTLRELVHRINDFLVVRCGHTHTIAEKAVSGEGAAKR